MAEDSNRLPGATSLQWHGPWALQLWLDEPGSDASTEVFKVSIAPGETYERSIDARPGGRARLIVVSDPKQEFRCRVERREVKQASSGESSGPVPHRWTGSTRLEVSIPTSPGRVTTTIDTERSGRVRLDFDVIAERAP